MKFGGSYFAPPTFLRDKSRSSDGKHCVCPVCKFTMSLTVVAKIRK